MEEGLILRLLVPKQVEGIVWSQMLFDLSITASLGNYSVCT